MIWGLRGHFPHFSKHFNAKSSVVLLRIALRSDMKYIVEEPNGNLHEIAVPKNALGQVCFEKICNKLGILEQHYFGLTRSLNHETKVWLNLRNPLVTQHRPHITSKPHRLRLDVKFYVLPQEIQHERTSHFFYHALKRNLRDEKLILSQKQLIKLHALIRQIEHGDFTIETQIETSSSPIHHGPFPHTMQALINLEKDIRREHASLKGLSERVAKIKFISLLSETEFYFCDLFKVKLGGEKLLVAVGTMGLQLLYRRTPQTTKEFVSYYDITKISLFEERMILVIKRPDDGNHRFLHFFHPSCDSAKVMHKCVLEKKLFYFEPKILDSVRNHYMLSFPCWAYPSKWLKKSTSELYHLDVRYTRRQAYEVHFAALCKEGIRGEPAYHDDEHHSGNYEEFSLVPYCKTCHAEDNMVAYSPCGHIEQCIECAMGTEVCSACATPVADKVKTYLAMDGYSDELCCQICMDKELSTVFSPCGHSYCCEECADKLNFCPMCKRWILFAQRIQFLALRDINHHEIGYR